MKHFISLIFILFQSVVFVNAQSAKPTGRVRILVKHAEQLRVDDKIIDSFNRYMDYQNELIKFSNTNYYESIGLMKISNRFTEHKEWKALTFNEIMALYFINGYGFYSLPADVFYFKSLPADSLNIDYLVNFENVIWRINKKGKVSIKYDIKLEDFKRKKYVYKKTNIQYFDKENTSGWGLWGCNKDKSYEQSDTYRFDCITKQTIKLQTEKMVILINEHFNKSKKM